MLGDSEYNLYVFVILGLIAAFLLWRVLWGPPRN